MKFGKEFKKQMIPEWTEAYVKYNDLKRILKEINGNKKPKTPERLTMYKSFSGLDAQSSNIQTSGDIEDQVIAVSMTQKEDSTHVYKTQLLKSPEEGGENEITFFINLDHELNKVNTFYKDKVEEVMAEAALLNKQMNTLIALRIKVEIPDFDYSSSLRRLSSDISSRAPLKIGSPCRGSENIEMTDGIDTGTTCQTEDFVAGVEVSSVISTASSSPRGEELNISEDRPVPLDILDNVRINNTPKNPASTIKGVLRTKETDLRFKKEELRKVERKLKMVFAEFYHKLRLLKHYSFMNLTAISKITKKYDKITNKSAAKSYMKTVDNSYLGSSEEVTCLLESVEATFIKHFSNSNRSEGMKLLRPKRKRGKHRITFFSGFFSGCSIALLVAVILIIEARNLMNKEEGQLFMKNIFPLYSFYAFIVLHMLLYSVNIYFWKLYRINYPFIFGFKLGTELGQREVFLFSSGLSVVALATFLTHLHMKMDLRYQDYEIFAEMAPLGLVTFILIIIFCPFNIIYRSSRYFLIKCIFRCFFAPLYVVTLSDFFLADQITSQIEAIRTLQFYFCYYGLRMFSNEGVECHDHEVYNVFYFIVAVIPYWLRFLQCLRRMFDDKDVRHGYNGVRYLLTIIAVVIRTAYEQKKDFTFKVLTLVSSIVAAIANTCWDLLMDWGLLHWKSKNFLLRDKLIVPHKIVYFLAMVFNVILRFAWLQLVLRFDVPSLQRSTVADILACLEILRRGMWNFFRLENEHLNNAGNYRAFRSVPLPFSYYDVDTEKDD